MLRDYCSRTVVVGVRPTNGSGLVDVCVFIPPEFTTCLVYIPEAPMNSKASMTSASLASPRFRSGSDGTIGRRVEMCVQVQVVRNLFPST